MRVQEECLHACLFGCACMLSAMRLEVCQGTSCVIVCARSEGCALVSSLKMNVSTNQGRQESSTTRKNTCMPVFERKQCPNQAKRPPCLMTTIELQPCHVEQCDINVAPMVPNCDNLFYLIFAYIHSL